MIKSMLLIMFVCALSACTPEKPAEPPQKMSSFMLSQADKDGLLVFQKNLLNTENLADKAVKVAVDEIKKVITGGEMAGSLPAIIDVTKAECFKAGEELAKSTISNKLPPELQVLLNDGKNGLIASYKAYGESFEIIKRFLADKNPMVLLEYRKKFSQAQDLYRIATDKIKQGMNAAGVPASAGSHLRDESRGGRDPHGEQYARWEQ